MGRSTRRCLLWSAHADTDGEHHTAAAGTLTLHHVDAIVRRRLLRRVVGAAVVAVLHGQHAGVLLLRQRHRRRRRRRRRRRPHVLVVAAVRGRELRLPVGHLRGQAPVGARRVHLVDGVNQALLQWAQKLKKRSCDKTLSLRSDHLR